MSASPEEVQTTCSTQEIAIAILQPLQDCLCAQYLTERYLARIFDETKIPIIESYINLALIAREDQREKEKQHTRISEDSGGVIAKLLDDHRLPSNEEIYAAKESMPLEQLFTAKEGEPAPRKLLILGRAGIGKTVLCQYLAVRWALAVQQPSIPDAAASSAAIIPLPWLSNFAAVFWLKLREIKIPDAGFKTQYGLAELIRAKCLCGPKKSSLKLEQLDSYLQENSEKILFILDGYDEIESIIGNEQYSIFNTIFTELTQHRNVILTSRPTCSCKFTADRTLENMGFIDQNVIDYITKFMHGTEVNIENFISYLKSSPSIWGIAHIPVTLEMLCWLHKKGELNLTLQTLSELYQQVVTRLTSTMADQMLGQVRKYPALQEKVIKDVALKFLALLAYNAMLGNELLITSSTIQETVHILNITDTALIEKLLLAGNNLGFIKTTNEGGTRLSDQAHYFIHLSFQEYFAAEYIAKAFLSGNQKVIDLIRQEKYQPRYQLMLWFVAGLLYLHGKQHTNDFTALNLFWQVLLDEPQDLFGLKQAELVAHCLDECLSDEKVEIHKHLLEVLGNWLVYCLKEDNYSSVFYEGVLYRCKHTLASEVISNLLLRIFKNQRIDIRIYGLDILSKVSQLSEDTYQWLLGIANDSSVDAGVKIQALDILSKVSLHQKEACQRLWGIANDSSVDAGVKIQALDILSKVSQLSEDTYQGLLGIANAPLVNAMVRSRALDILSKVSPQWLLDITNDLRVDAEVRIHALDRLSQVPQYQEVAYKGLLGIAKEHSMKYWVRIEALKILSKVSQLSEDTCQRLLDIANEHLVDAEVRIHALDMLSQVPQYQEEAYQRLLGIAKEHSIKYWVRIEALKILSKVSQLSEDTCQRLLDIANEHLVDARVRIHALKILSKVSQLSEDTCQRLLDIANEPLVDARVRIDALDMLSNVSQYQEVACQGLLGIANDSSLDDYWVRTKALEILSKISQYQEVACQGLLGIANDSSLDDYWVRTKALEILSKVPQYQEEAYQRLLGIANSPNLDAWYRIEALKILSKVSQLSEDTCRGLLGIVNDHRVKYYWVRIEALNVLSNVSQLSEDTCRGLLGIAKDSSVDAIVRTGTLGMLSKVSQLSEDTYQGLLGIANDPLVVASVRIKSAEFLFSDKNFTVWINEKTNVEALFSVCLMLANPLVMTCNIFKAKDNFSINSQTLTLPLHKLREVIQTFRQLKEKLGIPCFSTTIARESMLTPLIEGNTLKPKPERNPLPYPSQGQITFDMLMQLRIKEEAWQLLRKSAGYTLKFFNQYGFPAVKIELVREATIDVTTVLAAALEESLKIPNIYYIDLSGNNLVNIALLINAIYGEHPNIPLNKFYGILVLSNNHITGHAFEELLMALAEHPCITTLLLDRNQIYFEPIFITRKVNSLSFLVERAGINLIDLTLNFILKGFEFKEKDKIRIYYDRNAPILSEEKIKLKRVAIKTFFAASSYIHSRRCKESTPPMLIESLITIGKEAREKIITWEHGAVGLFVNKTNILNAHAYLMLEGISSFGQRYLIRGELFARRDGGVNIRVSLCTPEAFKYFTENTLQKTAILSREKIKKILIAMCSSRDVEDFIDYAALAKPSEKGCYSCVKWALNILAAGIPEQYIVDGLNPLAVASHGKKLKFW